MLKHRGVFVANRQMGVRVDEETHERLDRLIVKVGAAFGIPVGKNDVIRLALAALEEKYPDKLAAPAVEIDHGEESVAASQ